MATRHVVCAVFLLQCYGDSNVPFVVKKKVVDMLHLRDRATEEADMAVADVHGFGVTLQQYQTRVADALSSSVHASHRSLLLSKLNVVQVYINQLVACFPDVVQDVCVARETQFGHVDFFSDTDDTDSGRSDDDSQVASDSDSESAEEDVDTM